MFKTEREEERKRRQIFAILLFCKELKSTALQAGSLTVSLGGAKRKSGTGIPRMSS